MHAFASTVVGSFLILAVAAADDDNRKQDKDAKGKEPQKVELTGTLRTGIVAIGGETTGTLIETKKGKFELDLGKKKELRQKAEKLNGKIVSVTGTLEIRKGVEVKERKIVRVTSLEEAKDK